MYATPPFLPRKSLPDLGTALVSADRYHSPEFMKREWSAMWTKVWNIGIRESEVPESGDYVVHQLGHESFLFVRGADRQIRAFYNVCRHRGTRLCQAEKSFAKTLKCPYHGWEWNLDGSLRKVSDPQFFRQFDEGVPAERLGLKAVLVECWGGWVWFNMNLQAGSLESYLGDIKLHLNPYQLERWTLIDYRTFEWGCNWKHTVDAFNESYHFLEAHPQTVDWADGYDTPNELMGFHNRMLQRVGTTGPAVPDTTELSETLRHIMRIWFGIDPDTYIGSAKDVYREIQRRKRAIQDETHLPYRGLNDEQLCDLYHYTIFPNYILSFLPEVVFIFRIRPHAADPARCYFDHFILQHLPPGTAAPDIDHRMFPLGTITDYSAAFEGKMDPSGAQIIAQDAANLEPIQFGSGSDSFEGAILGEQEIGVRHFHQVLDRFLAGEAKF